jgi:hypothetical protein
VLISSGPREDNLRDNVLWRGCDKAEIGLHEAEVPFRVTQGYDICTRCQQSPTHSQMNHFPFFSPSPNDSPKRCYEPDGDNSHFESKKLRTQLEAECLGVRSSTDPQPTMPVKSTLHDAFYSDSTNSSQHDSSLAGNARCTSETLDPTTPGITACLQSPDESKSIVVGNRNEALRSASSNVSISRDSSEMDWMAPVPTPNPVAAFTMFDGGSPWDESESNEYDSCFGVVCKGSTQ